MKFLVFGAGGMAGHTISIYLSERGHEVVGFELKPLSYVKSISGDATDTREVRRIVREGGFDVVINAIGILNKSAEEHPATAVFLNSYFPHFLADITKDLDTFVIHMSTDCVFSGRSGNYTEDSFRDGETFYDRTKALGELEDGKNLTFRNSIVGPDINPGGIGLLNWFMKQEGTIRGYTHAMWTGMTTLQLAKMMEKAALCHATGLYNMVPDHAISKHDLLGLFNHYIRNDRLTITPYDDFVCDKALVRTRFDFPETVPDYDTMVREMADWMRDHRSLYPHYDLQIGESHE